MTDPVLPVGGSQVAGGYLPVVTSDDVEAVLPAFLQPSDPSPVRDALIAALTAIMQTYQARSEQAANLSNILRATGPSLMGLAEDHGIYAQTGESDETLRSRILDIPSLITPTAIMAAVTSILSNYTSIQPQYFEGIDRWFVGGSAPRAWHSYVWGPATSAAPDYPDRYYILRPQSSPGGARVMKDMIGRVFFIRVPVLNSLLTDGAFVSSGSASMSIGSLNARTFVRAIGFTDNDVYASIVNTVNRIKGQGIRFGLIVDTKLK